MFTRLLLTLSFVLCFQSAFAEDRPEVGRYVKCFSGDIGVKLCMMRIGPETVGPKSNHEVIIQVFGVDHPWDRKIVKHKVTFHNDDDEYMRTVDGEDWTDLRVRGIHADLNLQNIKRSFNLNYDDALSAQMKPQHFLTAYLDQEAQQPKPKQEEKMKKNPPKQRK